MATDADDQDNQKEAQAKWRAANPDYWRNYRQQHEKYCERNRLLQKKRDAKRRARRLAKMDALNDVNHIKPMGYYHIASTPSDLAKMLPRQNSVVAGSSTMVLRFSLRPLIFSSFCDHGTLSPRKA
jgi:hypothetical protein